MQLKSTFITIAICVVVGGLLAVFTPVKWSSACLWVFASLFFNGALAYWEDGQSGGFDNPEGNTVGPSWWNMLRTLLLVGVAVAVGAYLQFS